MRSRLLAVLLVPALAGSALAQEITGVDAELAKRAPRIVAIVSPDYPKAHLARGETAEVDLRGRVGADGTLVVSSLAFTGGDETFAAAIREVAPFWTFMPPIDPEACASRADDLNMRVWFEIADGKPKISVSQLAAESALRSISGQPGHKTMIRRKSGSRIVYPAQAQRKGIEGHVLALVKVDRAGQVAGVHVRPGLHRDWFDGVVTRTLGDWTFDLLPDYPADKPHICAELDIQFRLVGGIESYESRPKLPMRVQ